MQTIGLVRLSALKYLKGEVFEYTNNKRGVIEKLPLFSICSKSIYLFINNYLVPFKVIPLAIIHFSNYRNIFETRFLPTAPVSIFLLSPQS